MSEVQTDGLMPASHYRHVKRGTVYEVIGTAELQMSFDCLVDGSEMVVYRGEDGKMWCREESEFLDGRFEPAPGALPPPPGTQSVVQELVEALMEARKIVAEIDDYMMRPERGDWGAECACCMGELLDDDREAIDKIDALLTRVKG